MDKKEPDVPARGMPYEGPLGGVVEGLKHDPILLFGIGAGILVVGVLAFASNVWIVLVVAALFVAVLGARLRQDTRHARSGVKTSVIGTSVDEGSDAGNVADPNAGPVSSRFIGSSIKGGSRVGNVGEPRKPPEG